MIELTKVCSKCNEEKELSLFRSRGGSQSHLLHSHCKSCNYSDYLKWIQANPNNVKEYRVKDNAYKKANRDVFLLQRRAHYLANKEVLAAQKRAYKKANPHIPSANNAKRRATKLQATPAWADLEAIRGMYELAAIFNRTGMNLQVDHIVPLRSKLVCGLHCEANLQLMPASDNASKGNRHWPDQ